MSLIYLDCFTGISGDMCLGALINAGADRERLETDLRKISLHGWEMKVVEKKSHGITGTKVDILVSEEHQPHRCFEDIKLLIAESPLPEKVKKDSLNIFKRLAEAEGRIHGVPADRVHFHEVGGVDSILDIVGTALALFYLKIEKMYCSPLPPGRGIVKCRHGLLPVPAPATAELLKGIPLRSLDIEGELVTPTGAAIASTLACSFGPLPEMRTKAVGYGFGSKDFGIPNFLRVFIGDSNSDGSYDNEPLIVMETNIDDMNPEFLGHIMDCLFENRALDVFISPAFMKKNRPGYLLTVLCHPAERESLLKILFSETSTLGVRWREEQKTMLGRRLTDVTTPYGKVSVKLALTAEGTVLRAAPEYEDCRKIAREKNIPVREIYESALMAIKKRDEN